MPLRQDGNEDDYTMDGESVWIQVGKLQIHIRDFGVGVTVDMYGADPEQVALASTYAAYNDA